MNELIIIGGFVGWLISFGYMCYLEREARMEIVRLKEIIDELCSVPSPLAELGACRKTLDYMAHTDDWDADSVKERISAIDKLIGVKSSKESGE